MNKKEIVNLLLNNWNYFSWLSGSYGLNSDAGSLDYKCICTDFIIYVSKYNNEYVLRIHNILKNTQSSIKSNAYSKIKTLYNKIDRQHMDNADPYIWNAFYTELNNKITIEKWNINRKSK